MGGVEGWGQCFAGAGGRWGFWGLGGGEGEGCEGGGLCGGRGLAWWDGMGWDGIGGRGGGGEERRGMRGYLWIYLWVACWEMGRSRMVCEIWMLETGCVVID